MTATFNDFGHKCLTGYASFVHPSDVQLVALNGKKITFQNISSCCLVEPKSHCILLLFSVLFLKRGLSPGATSRPPLTVLKRVQSTL